MSNQLCKHNGSGTNSQVSLLMTFYELELTNVRVTIGAHEIMVLHQATRMLIITRIGRSICAQPSVKR